MCKTDLQQRIKFDVYIYSASKERRNRETRKVCTRWVGPSSGLEQALFDLYGASSLDPLLFSFNNKKKDGDCKCPRFHMVSVNQLCLYPVSITSPCHCCSPLICYPSYLLSLLFVIPYCCPFTIAVPLPLPSLIIVVSPSPQLILCFVLCQWVAG